MKLVVPRLFGRLLLSAGLHGLTLPCTMFKNGQTYFKHRKHREHGNIFKVCLAIMYENQLCHYYEQTLLAEFILLKMNLES